MTDDGVEFTAPDRGAGLALANDILRAGYRDMVHEHLERDRATLAHLGTLRPPGRESFRHRYWRWREILAERLEQFADRVRGI